MDKEIKYVRLWEEEREEDEIQLGETSFETEHILMSEKHNFIYCDEDNWLRWIPKIKFTPKQQRKVEDELYKARGCWGTEIQWDYGIEKARLYLEKEEKEMHMAQAILEIERLKNEEDE